MSKENFAKGRKAEKIVKDLFTEAGFKVINYGYEYLLPKLADKDNLLQGKAGQYIRHQPDFIVINKSNEAFFIEVKHRSSKIFPDREIFPYPSCYAVLLTKQNILAQSTDKLFLKREGFEPITEMPPFKSIPEEVLIKYVKKLKRTLGDETLTGQYVEKFVKKLTGKNLQEDIDNFEVILPKPEPKPEPKPKPKPTSKTKTWRPTRPPKWIRGKRKGLGKRKTINKEYKGKKYKYKVTKKSGHRTKYHRKKK